ELSKHSDRLMFLSSKIKNKEFVLLFTENKNKEKTAEILQRYEFSQSNLSNIQGMKGTSKENIERISSENSSLVSKKYAASKKLDALKDQYGAFLLASDDFLSEQLEKAEAPLKFASTQSAFLIRGWVPTTEVENLKTKLSKISKNKLSFHSE